MKTIVVDLACGYLPEHTSEKESVGIDVNFSHGKPKVDHPILGSVYNIPLRKGIAGHLIAKDILEHIDPPSEMLLGMKYIAKPKATVYVQIPVESNLVRQQLTRLYREFPFSLMTAVRMCWKARTVWTKHIGMLHLYTISPKYLNHFFKITRVRVKKQPSMYWIKWLNTRGWNKLSKRIGLKRVHFEQELYSVWCIDGVMRD